jgi:hypothetical protein
MFALSQTLATPVLIAVFRHFAFIQYTRKTDSVG